MVPRSCTRQGEAPRREKLYYGRLIAEACGAYCYETRRMRNRRSMKVIRDPSGTEGENVRDCPTFRDSWQLCVRYNAGNAGFRENPTHFFTFVDEYVTTFSGQTHAPEVRCDRETDRQTDRQTVNYGNPRCACAPKDPYLALQK